MNAEDIQQVIVTFKNNPRAQGALQSIHNLRREVYLFFRNQDFTSEDKVSEFLPVARLFLKNRINLLPKDTADWSILASEALFNDQDELNIRNLFCALCMRAPFECRLPKSLAKVPAIAIEIYALFILQYPEIFVSEDDKCRYLDHFKSTVSLYYDVMKTGAFFSTKKPILSSFFSNSQFFQSYFSEINLNDLFQKRARLLEYHAMRLGAHLQYNFPLPSPTRTKRVVGFFASNFSHQTDSFFTLSLFEHLPRSVFQIKLFVLESNNNSIENHCRSIADEFHVLKNRTAEEVATSIRQHDVDLLLISSNVTTTASLLSVVAAFRMARIQIITPTSPVSPGYISSDYFLSAKDNEPAIDSQKYYREKLELLPGNINYYSYNLDTPPQTVQIDRQILRIPNDAVIFFSGANFFKILPEVRATWVEILKSVPNSFLILMPYNKNWSPTYDTYRLEICLQGAFQAFNVSFDRLRVISPVETRTDLQAIMKICDVYLDAFPFPGACSLVDPILCGLPTVSYKGSTFRNRVSYAMLHAFGLGHLATDSTREYKGLAISLGNSLSERKKIRDRIEEGIRDIPPFYRFEELSQKLTDSLLNMLSSEEQKSRVIDTMSTRNLATHIEEISQKVASDNTFFWFLSDVEIVRLIVIPYFQSLPNHTGRPRRALDVGACLGQISLHLLANGWTCDMFEPDPACHPRLKEISNASAGKAYLHRYAISTNDNEQIDFHQSQIGLSGLTPSPYCESDMVIKVPTIRLDTVARNLAVDHVEFIKIDAEGWDFDILNTLNFEKIQPDLIMVEFGVTFPQQSRHKIELFIKMMNEKGYDIYVFQYNDFGNFKKKIWEYRLSSITFNQIDMQLDGDLQGNMLLYRSTDKTLPKILLQLLNGFLPGNERIRLNHNEQSDSFAA